MAILGALVLLAPAGCTRKNANSRTVEESVVQVNAEDVVRIQTRRIESGVAFTGDLAPVQTVEITSRFDGDLDAVHGAGGPGDPARASPGDIPTA